MEADHAALWRDPRDALGPGLIRLILVELILNLECFFLEWRDSTGVHNVEAPFAGLTCQRPDFVRVWQGGHSLHIFASEAADKLARFSAATGLVPQTVRTPKKNSFARV